MFGQKLGLYHVESHSAIAGWDITQGNEGVFVSDEVTCICGTTSTQGFCKHNL